jgi:predicted protein tyrosine phosphatase
MDEIKIKQVASKVITQIFLNKALNSIENDIAMPEISLVREDGRLLLGRLEHACNPQVFIRYGITHVVNVCQADNLFEKGLEEGLKHARLGMKVKTLIETSWKSSFQTPKYLRCPISDKSDSNIKAHFETAHSFIKNALAKENGVVLIHCQAGVSRSSTICISYLMAVEGMSHDAAFAYVKSKRSVINPNPGFRKCLKDFEESLGTIRY